MIFILFLTSARPLEGASTSVDYCISRPMANV